PVVHAAIDDAAVDGGEVVLGDEERVVLAGDVFVAGRGEVHPDAVVGVDLPERAEARRRGQAEEVGEPRGGGLAVAGGDDRVVELQGHASSLPPSAVPV